MFKSLKLQRRLNKNYNQSRLKRKNFRGKQFAGLEVVMHRDTQSLRGYKKQRRAEWFAAAACGASREKIANECHFIEFGTLSHEESDSPTSSMLRGPRGFLTIKSC